MLEYIHSGTCDVELLGRNQLDHKLMSAILVPAYSISFDISIHS